MCSLTPGLAATVFAGTVMAVLAGIPMPQETPSQKSTAELVSSQDSSARAHLRPVRVILASPYGPQTEMAPALSAPARSVDGDSVEERPRVETALDSENLTGSLTPAKPIVGYQRTAQKSRSTRAKPQSSEQSRDSAMPRRQEFSTSPRDYASSFDERRM